ncbi:MAG: VWA domain-containing protein, partial [Bacteroidota bacterium]|nr:VWA domain-containing protein [Bacteroidota bacterium]
MNTGTRSHRRLFLAAVTTAALLLTAASATAQTNLNFKRVVVNWPTIELYFATDCNGQPAWNLQKSDIRIFENGIPVEDFTLFCPNDSARCAISVSLVFDASGSMSGTGNAGAKQAGRTFIDQMDGVVDEASILWFNTQVNIAQQMTTIKPLLYSAVDGLPAGGGTAVWDGIYAGIIELVNNGVNQCRAVVVMTDGKDNASTRTPAEIISLANRNRIRVYTVGVGSSINATELEMIALLTGGRYYQTPSASQVADIYRQIANIILNYFEECTITYQRDCADGAMRSVELGVYNFCGGTDVKTRTYRAPLDSSTFGDLHMSIGKTVTMGGEEALVALRLDDNIAQAYFAPFSFELHYDSTLLVFRNAALAAGGPLDSTGLDVTLLRPGVLSLATTDRAQLSGSGPLMDFLFEAKLPPDTSCAALTVKNATFAYGCFDPVIEDGEVCVYPRSLDPVVVCEGITAPTRLTWDADRKQLTPFPFTVTARHRNVGLADGEQFYFRLQYDSTKLRLADSVVQLIQRFPADSRITSHWNFEAR